MRKLKVIKCEEQYRDYLEQVHELLNIDTNLTDIQADEIELLTVLIEAYEAEMFPLKELDPISAIEFRMHEKRLKQVDLVPYFGSRSRVSEILNRKRPLTVPMIRAVSVGLGIPPEVLIQAPACSLDSSSIMIDWNKFPYREMQSRGWIKKVSKSRENIETEVRKFVEGIGWEYGEAAFRRTVSGEAPSPTTLQALYAWLVRVVQISRRRKSVSNKFDKSVLSTEFITELVQLSWFQDGPNLAVEFLEKSGIAVVIEPHLKGTMLDGAALQDTDGTPIIGLTLRYDRLDNFWFTLAHEIAHIWKHVGEGTMYLDDLKVPSTDPKESEANRIAREALIPKLVWKRSENSYAPTKESIQELSRQLRIHPSIIAGRIHRETGRYDLFSDLVGHGEASKSLAKLISS